MTAKGAGSVSLDHFEERFGAIEEAWTHDGDDVPIGFTVARLRPPDDRVDLATYATFGLSDYLLGDRTGGQMRLECIIRVFSYFEHRWAPPVLAHIGRTIVAKGDALLRGDTINLGAPLEDHTTINSLYCTMAFFLDEDSRSLQTVGDEAVAVIWLIPIMRSEAEFAGARGWENLEDLLEVQGEQLFDIYRESVLPLS